MNTYPLNVHYCRLEHTLTYENTPMLTYDISYPIFKCASKRNTLDYLNIYYDEKACLLETYAEKIMFPLAVKQFKDSVQMSFPFHPYELTQAFSITYNQDNVLSLYYDQYLFTGGAHGNTVRYSNTWDLKTNSILMLKDFFPANPEYRRDIIEAVNSFISKEKADDNNDFFDDYKQNVEHELNENNYYITPEGIVVYFQQYQIAPYSYGIPQFLLPWGNTAGIF